ncbi:Hypothetical protein R9X50_00094800 [Acrodontium crateriforme]|uniref:Amino acid transporter n=1 Tax=Acrodontium crateriforme TaxID=150365 RepID=A0AAQ3M167_9PEZI|nr:Hypothetical protein R9X50_00094800 [Acrodontium crateriforme]
METDDYCIVDDSGDGGTKARTIQKGGNSADERDMRRMGKHQELRRNFKLVGIIGFITILQATWESTLLANYFGLLNGGTAGVIWCTIATWLFMLCMIASLAECASIAPTAGGQYHWVSEFAPPSLQKSLSYVVGWCCCLGWIAGIPACAFQLAGLVQEMVLLGYPDANIQQLWQQTLIVFLFILLTVGFNIFFAHHLPLMEGIILFLHFFAFFAFLLVLWIMPKTHQPAKEVFTTFYDGGGWGNIGLSCLVGLATPIWCFIGPDAGAHMSEELKDASLQLPRAMMWATCLNGIAGITMLITFCFCIDDLQDIVGPDASSYPIIQILYKVTNSYAATCLLGSFLVLLLFFSTITTIASASRSVWAFSRDGGLPYSSWICQVRPEWEIPVSALLVCLVASLILSAINFGSNVAFQAILSVSNAALIFSYIVSIICIRLKRLRGETLLPRRWSLGKFGGLINDLTLAFLVVGFVFSFFPAYPSVGDSTAAADFNWSILIFTVTCVVAMVYYTMGGKDKYIAPVSLVKEE